MRRPAKLPWAARWLRRLLIWSSATLAVGYVLFVVHAARMGPPAQAPKAEGMVVLTGGGGDRIKTAIMLMEQGAAQRLLISGVNPEVADADIRELASGHDALFDCCIDLGRNARTTVGNGWESADWVQRNGFSSLVLVTSDYHMARSAQEMKTALPGVQITPYPVRSERINPAKAWCKPRTAWRMMLEYLKFLAAYSRAPFHDGAQRVDETGRLHEIFTHG